MPARGPATTGLVLGLFVALALSVTPIPEPAGPPAPAERAAAATPTTAAAGTALRTVVIPDLGPGYAVTSEGPLDPSAFASDSPDPAAASGALAALGKTISTYERMWQANGGLNQVQDLLVRFPSTAGAEVFVRAARHALDAGEIASKGTLASVPGAHVVTYFAATNEAGVGEAITMRSGIYVALLSFFSAAAGNPQPITPADAEQVARAQHAAMAAAPGGTKPAPPAPARGAGAGGAGVVAWVALAVAALAVVVATALWLHRRRARLAHTIG